MRDRQRIVIVGFMGAGKTTVARELARLLDCAELDLDDYITRREGRTPQELIDVEGEARFREIEQGALAEVLDDGAARVVALGGGAWTVESNRALVARERCLSVWLDAPFDLCWHRITRPHSHERPLARDPESAHRLYEARRSLYALADIRVRVAGQSAARVAAEIEKLLPPVQDGEHTDEPQTQDGTKEP